MKIANHSVELLSISHPEPLKLMELAGRTCYQSQDRITEDSACDFARMLVAKGHESVLEHCSATFRIITDRGVMAELTRHRTGIAFSIESTRYCDYSGDIVCILPVRVEKNESAYRYWIVSMEEAETNYRFMRKTLNVSPEDARCVLPMSLKTEIIMTANFRELRHILKLRTSKAAHPDMRHVASLMLEEIRKEVPIVFDDI